MFDYIDIHSHLYFPDFDSDREEMIEKMKQERIATITIGTSLESSRTAVEMAEKHHNLFACVGLHPGDITLTSPRGTLGEQGFLELAKHPRTVAIGECGLDYFRLEGEAEEIKELQKKIFEQHIELALEVDKPLMLHIRSTKKTFDAYGDALDILEKYFKIHGKKLRGNAHFFAGDMEVLKRFLAIGFTVSFTGVITFTKDYDEFIRYTPLNMIMSETDSPFVAPVPYRGSRNSPLYVPEVVKKISEIHGEPIELVQKTLRDNAVRFFNLN